MPTILQVTAGFSQGGVERGTLEMANYLAGLEWGSHVASAAGVLTEHLANGVPHHVVPLESRTPWAIWRNAGRLETLMREVRPDVVHARSRAPASAAYLACGRLNIPFMTTFHGTYGTQTVLKKAYNKVMLKGRRVVAISDFIKNHIVTTYGEGYGADGGDEADKTFIRVVPRGFDPHVFNRSAVSQGEIQALRERYGVNAQETVFLMPGRLTRWKGQMFFLEALAQLSQNLSHGSISHGGWKALIVGGDNRTSGAYEAELNTVVRAKGLEDRVILCGPQHLPPFYAASDVVVSASLRPEAFGRVAVEAQSMGKPVIATAHGGSLETVISGETGWLVAPDDVPMFADALGNVLLLAQAATGELPRMGERAYTWAHNTFTIDKMCAGERAVYEELMGER